MARIRTTITVPPEDTCYTVALHFGDLSRYASNAWHLVYGYAGVDVPPGVTAYHEHDYLWEALLEAQSWTSMPLIVADICYYCRATAPGPHLPRWNIYRGPDLAPAPPCIFWDFYWGPPPWPPV